MKLHLASLSLLALCLMLVAVPAVAQVVVWNNGPCLGTNPLTATQAQIGVGDVVSNSFNANNQGRLYVTGFTFCAWLFPGDVLSTVELSITSKPNGGTIYFDKTENIIQGGCTFNGTYNVCMESTADQGFGEYVLLQGPPLNGPLYQYYLNLTNASVVGSGDPVYWDINSGIGCVTEVGSGRPYCPSYAYLNTLTMKGTTVSGSFTVAGCYNC
jgi:hypothetical protein